MPSGLSISSFTLALALCAGFVPGGISRDAGPSSRVILAQSGTMAIPNGPIVVPGSADTQQPTAPAVENPAIPLNNQNAEQPGDPEAAQDMPGDSEGNPAAEPAPDSGGENQPPTGESSEDNDQ